MQPFWVAGMAVAIPRNQRGVGGIKSWAAPSFNQQCLFAIPAGSYLRNVPPPFPVSTSIRKMLSF